MENNINLFNAIATLKVLAAENDAIKATLAVLEKELASVTAEYTIATGMEALNQQQIARQEVVDYLNYSNAYDWKQTVIDATIVDSWIGFINGSLKDGTLVELVDRRYRTSEKVNVSIIYFSGFRQPKVKVMLHNH